MHLASQKSFTLTEVLLATVIIALGLCGILAAYLGSFNLLSTSKNLSMGFNAAQGLMEEIRNTPFVDIIDDYDGLIFSVNNMPTNRGIVYVDDTDPDLLRVTISICWSQNNRVIGEDQDLDGILDAGEDILTANGIIDSPVQLVTLVTNR